MPRSPSKPAKSPRKGSVTPRDSVSVRTAKPSQRERLLKAMAQVVEREGYAGASVAKVIAGAGVGRVTFYEEFADKEECFLASYEEMAQRITGQMISAAHAEKHNASSRAALSSLLKTLEAAPDAGWGILFEPVGGAPDLRTRSRRQVAEGVSAMEAFLGDRPRDAPRLEVPALALIGGVRQVIARRLRRVEYDILPTLTDDLLAWVSSYALDAGLPVASFLRDGSAPRSEKARPAGSARSQTQAAAARTGASEAAAAQRLPRGRRKQRESFVNRQLRERILGATAEIALLKGYGEMTVADIVACAGIGRDVFYVHFKDKQDAFLAAQQHNLQDHMNACATSFFGAPTWPERIWQGLKTVTEIIAEDPALAHLWLVESFAAGPAAIQHTEEMMVICTLYLQEGYHYRPEAAELPQLSSEAIIGAMYELVYREIEEGRGAHLGDLLPQLTYIAIAPFTGAQQAAELIDGYVRARSG